MDYRGIEPLFSSRVAPVLKTSSKLFDKVSWSEFNRLEQSKVFSVNFIIRLDVIGKGNVEEFLSGT